MVQSTHVNSLSNSLKGDIHNYFVLKDYINICVIQELALSLCTVLAAHSDPDL